MKTSRDKGGAKLELRTLVERAQNGDVAAFTELARRYGDMVFAYALSRLGNFHHAEDAAQETFIAAWFNLPKLQCADAFPAWLRGIAAHQCSRAARRHDQATLSLDEAFGTCDEVAVMPATERTAERPEQALERKDLREAVLRAITTLTPPQREVTTLFYIREYSQKEIASFLGMPPSQVNNRLHAARQKLKRRLISMVQDTMQNALPRDFAENIGKIVTVRGSLVEARFDPKEQPDIFDALELADNINESSAVHLKVIQRLENGLIRGVATAPLQGIAPGMKLVNTKRPVSGRVSTEAVEEAVGLMGGPAPRKPQILETGIKAVDFLCPLVKGGKAGLFGLNGTGPLVLIEELIHRLAKGADRVFLFKFVRRVDADTHQHLSVLEPAYPGDAVGSVQTHFMLLEDASDPEYARSTRIVDCAIYFSPLVFVQGLYPAIDPLISTSRGLDSAIAGREHCDTVTRVRELMQHAKELLADPLFLEYMTYRSHGRALARWNEFLPRRLQELSDEDRRFVSRARKLQKFLTQPFHVAEPWTGVAAQWISCEATIHGCRQIADGHCDDVPEDAFYMAGDIKDVLRKAEAKP